MTPTFSSDKATTITIGNTDDNSRKRPFHRSYNIELLSGILIVAAFAIIALAAPLIAPPEEGVPPALLPKDGYSLIPLPPNADHPLGTMRGQYDIFYGLIWGTRGAFRIGLIITLGRALIGVLIGLLAGYSGGLFEALAMRLTDAFLAFPMMTVILVMLATTGDSTTPFYLLGGDQIDQVIITTLIAFGWMPYARLIRGNVLIERSKAYIEAEISVGAAAPRLIFLHLLPNASRGLLVMVASDVGAMVSTTAALSFLGFSGTLSSRPVADWGHILSASRDFIIGMPGNAFDYWYTFIPCSLAILFFSIGWNLIGDGLRDALDPRLNGRQAIKTKM
ncbi:MAG: ABC transporter permease [Anaerolineae bacterium]|jgi:peptide/nickel transport system permease protein|nr:ABC transporter permease [Anaerolineae bacterium]